MSFSGMPQVFDLNPFETSSIQEHQFGQLAVDRFGDLYRYAKAGASDISKGKLQLAPAPKTNHHNVACLAAYAIGTQKVTFTLGATAATANEYAGGFLNVNDNAGEGQAYRILSHPAADSAATLEVTLERPITIAFTTSTEATLVHNTRNGVVEVASKTRRAAGVPQVSITAGYFGWLKVRGVSSVLADQAITLGAQVCASASVAGAVIENADTTAPSTETIVGFANILAGVDTEYRAIHLTID